MSKYILVSLIIYVLYLEINPKIRGIWIRPNSEGNYVISFYGLYDLFIYPFKNIKMWFPMMWDMNVYISIGFITFIIYKIHKRIKYKKRLKNI